MSTFYLIYIYIYIYIYERAGKRAIENKSRLIYICCQIIISICFNFFLINLSQYLIINDVNFVCQFSFQN